jgi:polyribonucleotide nucleotidyltransferase
MKYKNRQERIRIKYLILDKFIWLFVLLVCFGLCLATLATYGVIQQALNTTILLGAFITFCLGAVGLIHKSKYSKERYYQCERMIDRHKDDAKKIAQSKEMVNIYIDLLIKGKGTE